MEINRARQPAAGRLGEIVNPATISTYFTESISIVFRFAYFTKPTAAGISAFYKRVPITILQSSHAS
jgi:hypothetical protein